MGFVRYNTYIAMKLNISMTNAQGKEQVVLLVEQQRTELALGMMVPKATVTPVLLPNIQHDFSMSSNNVRLTWDEYEKMVAAAADATLYGPSRQPQRNANRKEGLCFFVGCRDIRSKIARRSTRFTKQISFDQQQSKMRRFKHIVEPSKLSSLVDRVNLIRSKYQRN
jgi:hypothetical protein